ncbi:hypothetical protein K431DRAFT_218655 [Polychaeton citri CBS 116435]|uniref:Sulfite efflux pump SSU1 n=1 Tax=Polychaeton citri CBS 116435 TaxID=1314669 RepID=A0A9P4QD54_9PEZI|nr:hypothetical protein K431DRAFT_218655 [Polychaeton citri CBS 116435]
MDNNPANTVPASARTGLGLNLQRTITDPSGQEQLALPPGRQTPNLQLSKYERGWRRIVRNFSPSWFSVTMGTGIVSTLFIVIPWHATWLWYFGVIFFILNVILFVSALAISILRYSLYPEIWTVMIEDPTNSLFLGTMPMGFATIVEMWVFVCVPAWGEWAAYVAWAMWIVDAVVAVTVTVSLGVLLMSASHQRSLDSILATQLLPIAATVVAAGTGAEVSAILPNPQHALGTIIAAYVMWGLATPMAMSVLVMYYQRLALHKMPPREVIVSAFLPLGPLGFGGYTILYLGREADRVFPLTGTIDPMAGKIAYVLGLFVGLIMWGWGLMWLALALAAIHKSRPFPFNMGWWGFTFPTGVYACSTVLIGEVLPSLFFRVLGTILAVCVIILWIVVAAGTARGAWRGELFNAQCLKNLKPEKQVPFEDIDIEKDTAYGTACDEREINGSRTSQVLR